MALSTLLQIINRAEDELGLPRSSAVVSSSNPQALQLLAVANAAGRDLMRAHDWGALQTLGTLSTVNGTTNYSLASDFDRLISDATWDRTNDRRVVGPDSVQLNRLLLESGTAQAGINKRYRLRGASLDIYPTPTTAETIVYEYISNKWALSSGSVAQTEFQADADTSLFDPDLMKAEVKWRFMSAKGMYSEALYNECMSIRNQRIASDLGGTVLSMAPDPVSQFIGIDNMPDANWSL